MCDLVVQEAQLNSQASAPCQWQGGTLGVWVKAGIASNASVTITGADNITYLQGSFTYNCTAFYENVTLPAQNYTVTLNTGPGLGSCGNPQVILKSHHPAAISRSIPTFTILTSEPAASLDGISLVQALAEPHRI